MTVEFNEIDSFLAEVDDTVEAIRTLVHTEPAGEGAVRMVLIAGYIARGGMLHELRLDCGVAYEGPTMEEDQAALKAALEKIADAAARQDVATKGGRYVVA